MTGTPGNTTNIIEFTPLVEFPDDANCACDPTDAENPNETLGALRAKLAARMGYAANIAAGGPLPPGMDTKLNGFLQDAQEYLYRRYDVLRTERFFTWQLTQGERFYDIENNLESCAVKLDPRKITWVGVQRDTIWYDLIAGIPPELYTYNQNAYPSRYEIRQCIEIWPAPADGDFLLRIKGRFGLASFVNDTDKATIDSQLVYLAALANAKADAEHPDAANYMQQMEVMLRGYVAGSHQTRRYIPGKRLTAVQPLPIWARSDGTLING